MPYYLRFVCTCIILYIFRFEQGVQKTEPFRKTNASNTKLNCMFGTALCIECISHSIGPMFPFYASKCSRYHNQQSSACTITARAACYCIIICFIQCKGNLHIYTFYSFFTNIIGVSY